MSDSNNKPQEWHPDNHTQIIDEQTIISPISFELCSKMIVEIITAKRQLKRSRGELICSRLDELLAKSVGALEPSTKTLFGLENKAFKNTQNKLKLATIIADEVRLQLDKKLAGEAKEIAFKSIDGWFASIKKAPQQLPNKLNTEQAKIYFSKAVEAGLMTKQYKWQKSQLLLACFAREMSLKLCLNKAQNTDGTYRISWQPFEELFGLKKHVLRTSYNDMQKTGQPPKNIEIVDSIFKD